MQGRRGRPRDRCTAFPLRGANVAITGEITLQGDVTAIGGLELKILGGMKANVTTFIFPKDNENNYNKFKEKYDKDGFLDGITFVSVSHIKEVLKLVFA